jgi:tetratricopeptide (TPR) repeat protein
MSLAQGPHLNMDTDMDMNEEAACAILQEGLGRAPDAPEQEQAYLKALSRRCSAEPKYDPAKYREYQQAMRELVHAYPDDLDAATFLAEALLVPPRWQWFDRQGNPAEGVEDALTVLDGVLRRDPLHPLANHLYVHAIEMSPWPERGLTAAERLGRAAPGAGHLVHMAGHIYLRTGDFESALEISRRAVSADHEYMRLTGLAPNVYTHGYYPHTAHFIVYAQMMLGRQAEAQAAADELVAYLAPSADAMPEMFDYFSPMSLHVSLRFGDWQRVLAAPEPEPRLLYARAFRHYARALAHRGQGNRAGATQERAAFARAVEEIPADRPHMNNKARGILEVAAAILAARLADDEAAALPHWRQAVAAQDALRYEEPPAWYYPVRESLGGALLRSGQPAAAETAFREELRAAPRNGRCLFGLRESLAAQGKSTAAEAVGRELRRAWPADAVTLGVESL